MKNNNNKLFYVLLSLVVLITFLIGLFFDWQKMYYSPLLIVGAGVILIRLFSSQLEMSVGNRNSTFILFSLLNFIVNSVVSFFGTSGGMQGMMIVLPVLIIIGIIYVKLKERFSNKALDMISHIFIVICFMFATLIIMGAMNLASMGV